MINQLDLTLYYLLLNLCREANEGLRPGFGIQECVCLEKNFTHEITEEYEKFVPNVPFTESPSQNSNLRLICYLLR